MNQNIDFQKQSADLGVEPAPHGCDPEPGPDSTPGDGRFPTHGADNGVQAARMQFELTVQEKFARADSNALFTRPEIAVILQCSLSWLEKGSGPNTRLVGRLRRSTKADIVEFINDLPESDDVGNLYRFG